MIQKSKTETIYVALCTIFAVFVILANVVYQKFVTFHIMPFYKFEISAGAMLYPITFLITDLIVEFFDKSRARFCVILGLSMNIMVACVIGLIDKMNATEWSKIDNQTFHNVFGMYIIAFIGSTIACYISQSVDVFIYVKIRKMTAGKHLWLRNNCSTAISLFVDTAIVLLFLTIFNILPKEKMVVIMLHSYAFKLFFSICNTPLFYCMVFIMKLIINRQKHPTFHQH